MSEGHGRTGRGRRAVVALVLVALVGIGAGWWLATRIVSPAQAAANVAPPAPMPITVPLDERALSNQIVTRADVSSGGAVALSLNVGGLTDPAVVTAQPLSTGAAVNAGDVVLEVTGRPVIVLPGKLPAYRGLSVGMSGPDVAQLKVALTALGYAVGNGKPDTYDAATSRAVDELYAASGYVPAQPPQTAVDALTAAQTAVGSAQDGVLAAQDALTKASAGPLESTVIDLRTAVALAQQALASAQAACTTSPPTSGCDHAAVIAAQGALDSAQARLNEALAPPDASAASKALADAKTALTQAQATLAAAQLQVRTPLPASEVLFMDGLPRRIEQMDATLGGIVPNPVMTVSDATLTLTATVSAADASLLTVGMPAKADLSGTSYDLSVTAVGAASPTQDSTGAATPVGGTDVTIQLAPSGQLTAEEAGRLRDANVRVTIPVSATDGKVLAVPIAALTAGAGGESRVSVLQSDGSFALMIVHTGIAAEGYVEITSAEGPLRVGDRVLVGQDNTSAAK